MTDFKTQPPQSECGMNVAGSNEIDDRGRWYLSYNPSVTGYGCVTTALVLGNRVFFILEGDHREAWGEAADFGVECAMGYFMTQEACVSSFSEHRSALGLVADPFRLEETITEIISGQTFVALRRFFKTTNPRAEHEATGLSSGQTA